MMKTRVSYPQILGLSVICLTGFFFGNPQSDAGRFFETTNSQIKGSHKIDLPPMPEVQPYEPFVYKGASSDPFKLQEFVKNAASVSTPENQVCESAECGATPPVPHKPYILESYELSQLRMVGTVSDPKKGRTVLIQTPDVGIIETRVGEYIGKNNGLILSITPSEVTIQEKIEVPRGWQDRTPRLRLFN